MRYDFDTVVDRIAAGSIKWKLYPEGTLPMWVADMDFPSPPPIVAALQRQVATAEFGYAKPDQNLVEVIVERLERLYAWKVELEDIVFIPSLVTGIHAAIRAVGEPGDGVLMQTPVYPPFVSAPPTHQRSAQYAELQLREQDGLLHYDIDFDAFERAITDRTRLFLLCNPHNPTGVAYSRAEQQRMAEICERHNLIICSDEIHCDLLLGDTKHIPIASIAPEIAQRTITMMAPSKTFNVPGLKASFLVIPNAELRQRFVEVNTGIVPWVNNLGLIAMQAAYTECDEWLEQLRAYLTENRNVYVNFIREHLPRMRTTAPQATYLGWIDCRQSGIEGNPYTFFLEEGKLALNDGNSFGPGGEGFVRLNFGCPRTLLLEGLERLRSAVDA